MKFIALCVFLCLVHLSQGIQWEQVNPKYDVGIPGGFVTDGNGHYIMWNVDQDYSTIHVSYSSDGETWSESNFPRTYWTRICSAFYANNQFIIFIQNATYVSPNGQSWKTLDFNSELYDPVVAIGSGNSVTFLTISNSSVSTSLVSRDGVTWTKNPFPSAGEIYAVGQVFILSSWENNGTAIYYSLDGFKWHPFPLDPSLSPQQVLFYAGNGPEIIAYGDMTTTLYVTSDLGKNWESFNSTSIWLSEIFYACGRYGAFLNEDNELLTSHDLRTWVPTPVPGISNLHGFYIVGKELFVAGQVGYVVTSDYESWTIPDIGITEFWNNIYVLNGAFIFEGNDNISSWSFGMTYLSSTDGKTFTALSTAPFWLYWQTWESDGVFYFLDSPNVTVSVLFQTTDFVHWTYTKPMHAPCNFTALAYGNNIWVGMCYSPGRTFETLLYTTSNYATGQWKLVYTSPQSFGISYMNFGNGAFVLVYGITVVASTDGVTWKNGTGTLPNLYLTSLAFVGNFFFIMDESSLWVSSDGFSWTGTSVQISNPYFQYLPTSPGTYAAVGSNGMIATSTNALSWSVNSSYSIPTPNSLQAIAYNGKNWAAIDREAGIYWGS